MRNKKIIDPAQKFFEQIISGVADCGLNVSVHSISIRPVSASSCRKRIFCSKSEKIDNVQFIYPSFINGKISRFITQFFSCFFTVYQILRKQNEKCIVMCDPLYVHTSKAARFAAQLRRVKTIAVVTDIPIFATDMKKHDYSRMRRTFQQFYERLSMKELIKYDAYVNLTKFMNDIVNPNKKSSIIIEGSVSLHRNEQAYRKDQNIKILVYAGGINEKYGIKQLVNAFISAEMSNVELHIYGEGSFVEQLKLIEGKYENISYKGCVVSDELNEIEKQATLLVNPRLSNELYTFYSFPSKILEYMSSGTPVLTTRLKGIPEDYEPYLYWFDDESIEGMKDKISEVLSLDSNILDVFGEKAKRFVYDYKNNYIQGSRIVEFANEVAIEK